VDKLLEKDIALKLTAVVLAVILWFQVAAEQNPVDQRTMRDVRVELRNLPASMVILQAPPAVGVRVQGTVRELQRLSPRDITAYVDLQGAQPGSFPYSVTVNPPAGIEVAAVTPAQVTVVVDTLESRQVPVEVVAQGSLGDDYAARMPLVEPTQVRIQGPSSRVRAAARAVATLDIGGRTQDVTEVLPVHVVDVDGRELAGLQVTPATVRATVPVVQLPPPVTVPVEVVTSGRPAPRYWVDQISVVPAEVEVRAHAEAASLEVLRTQAVDIAGATGDVVRTVGFQLPPGVERVRPALAEVRVAIVFEPEAEAVLEAVPVVVENLQPGLQAQVRPAAVTMVVQGRKSLVDGLQAGELRAVVDGTSLGPGEHRQPPTLALPRDVRLVRVEPEEVVVLIRR